MAANPGPKAFSIDGWQVSPAEGVLSRGYDAVHLEPKVIIDRKYFRRTG